MRVVLGALLLFVGFLVGAGFTAVIVGTVHSGFFVWLKHWDTLIAGVLALIAGAVTAAVVVWQTRVSSRNVQAQLDADAAAREEALARKRMATRALLQSDLSHICHYAKKAAAAISAIILELRTGAVRTQIPMPEFPWSVLTNIQTLIEHLDRPEAEVVADMLGTQQVFNARLIDLIAEYNNGDFIGGDSINLAVEKCVELRLRADSMFDFSRRKCDTLTEPTFSDYALSNSLMNLDLADYLSDETKEYLETYMRALAAKAAKAEQ